MSTDTDHSIRHPGRVRLRLRTDLRFYPQTGQRPYCLVEDLVRSKYYRLGVAEYTFASLLDGNTTLSEALAKAANIAPMACFNEQDALSICKWLVDKELAEVVTGQDRSGSRKAAPTAQIDRYNPLAFRVPLLHPDRLFDAATPWIDWLFRPPAVFAWLLLIIVAGYGVLSDGSRFLATSRQVFAASNWIYLIACWIFLKVVHEFAHGVVCKRYGGSVREAGIIFVLFAPLAYVDVTCSWRFRSKWQRIFTATAGMYVEILIACLAAIVWRQSSPGMLSQLAFNIATMAGVNTLLFNANPLMRFDGYYILSDWVNLPNLYSSGQQYVHYLFRRYWFGVNPRLPDWGMPEAVLIRLYGIAAFAWRIVVCVGLVLVASTLFHGAGAILALIAVAMWLGRPAYRLAASLRDKQGVRQIDRRHFSVVSGLVVGSGALLLLTVPWLGPACAPGRVTYAPLHVIRPDSAGFVCNVRVMDGELVEAGQVLLSLENQELQRELQDLDLQIEMSRVKGRMYEQQLQLALAQAEQASLSALRTRREELAAQVSALTLRAPAAGQVVGSRLDQLVGTYVEEGEELLAIGSESEKELVISIAQENVHQFEAQLEGRVRVWFPGQTRLACRLTELQPRARLQPPDPAFAASSGGPIPVQPADGADHEFVFLAPRFVGKVALDAKQSESVRAGQFAIVSFVPQDEMLGEHLYRRAATWIRNRLKSASAKTTSGSI